MTTKTPVSAPQNLWFDAENVDDLDLTLEQNYNNLIQAGIRNNHFGSGVLANSLLPNVLFNSTLANGLLDGKAISAQNQPSDPNLGNQLQVQLSGSLAAGNRTVKVLIVGLDFQSNLQYDALTFHTNETQFTSAHYTKILTIFLNDFIGSEVQSLNLGGTLLISEASQFTLSRDCVMVSQDYQPNLFFRDFFVSSGGTLVNALSAALPSYNISNLGITTSYSSLRALVENDVSSQIGQKFQATTNNIQKITLLMAVVNNTTPSNLQWSGDLIVSLYPLQTSVSCPSDIAPSSAINFDPTNIPLVQLSITYASLMQSGIVLNGIPQPVDFIFSNTSVGSGLTITPNSFYAITVKRAGSASTCQLQFAVGTNSATNTIETLFNGTTWTNVPQEALWFQVWTDAAKVSDGQAYDNGNGMIIPKTITNSLTGLTTDYSLNQLQFVSSNIYYALAQATVQDSAPVQDEITGNNVDSNQQFVPSITLFTQAGLANIQNVSNPLIIGTISDENIKSPNTTPLLYKFHEYGIVNNELVIKVITDTTDGYRYDPSIIELVSELVEGNLGNATITPNVSNPNLSYRVVKGELITMTYGDVNGDGIVNEEDLLAIQSLMGYNLNSIPTYNGYVSDTNTFVNATAITWSVVNPVGNIVEASGIDGYVVANPLNGMIATFGSDSANFMSIENIGNYNLVISGQVINPSNNGSYIITALLTNNTLTIQKQSLSSDTILQVLRADIDGDMMITANDGYLLNSYVSLAPPFPPTSLPSTKIGTTFQAIRLTVEEVVDRNDDYPSTAANRATTLHPLPDMFLDGYAEFQGQNLTTDPLQFSIVKQLNWEDYNVESNSAPRQVPVAFTYQSGGLPISAANLGITYQSFPIQPSFDPGRNDFALGGNLVLTNGGQITTNDGYYYKVDFETALVVFEIPPLNFSNQSVNIFTDFVANYSTTGFTRIGYPAMKYADGSLVGMNDLANNCVRFSVGIQSFSPNLNGIDGYSYPGLCVDGIIIDPKIGVSFDPISAILTLSFSNLYQDPVQQTLNTKVQITVFLKKAGFNNQTIFIGSAQTQNLLGIPTPPYNPIVCPDPTNIVVA
jgi:hypothetical protein